MELVVMVNTEEEMTNLKEQMEFAGFCVTEGKQFPRYFIGDFREGLREVDLSPEELTEKNIFITTPA